MKGYKLSKGLRVWSSRHGNDHVNTDQAWNSSHFALSSVCGDEFNNETILKSL